MLENSLLAALCTVTWLVWVPAVVLQKKARGDAGGTSLFPVLPLFPLVGTIAGIAGNWLYPRAGTYVVSGLHVLLLASFVVTIVRAATAQTSKVP